MRCHMAIRPLWSVAAVLCLVCSVHAFESVFFAKFHKVGGTTAAIVLGKVAHRSGYVESCEGGPRTSCIEHDSLGVLRNTSLGSTPLERLEVHYPFPLKITLLRHPIEKLLSRVYFHCAEHLLHCDEEHLIKLLGAEWHGGCAEYASVLGSDKDGNVDLRLAIRTLESFDVVSVTDRLASLFVQVAHHLNKPVADFRFRSAKVIDGRPTYEELPMKAKVRIQQIMTRDEFREVQIYRAAELTAAERVSQFNLEEKIYMLEKISAELETAECDTSHHAQGGAGLKGAWCYELNLED